MRSGLAVVGLLLCIPGDAQKDRVPKRPRETVELVERTNSVPGEFAADILLRLASSKLIPDAAWKRELITRAFEQARFAQNPLRRTGSVWMDTVSGRISVARYLELDGLSLQTRAIHQMLPLDPAAGRSMFLEIRLPEWHALSCKDNVVPVFDEYYVSLLEVFERGFSQAERNKGDDVDFVQQRLRAIRSPLEIDPAAEVAIKLHSPSLLKAVAASIPQIQVDPRSCQATSSYHSLSGDALLEMGYAAKSFLQAMRRYFAKGFGEKRCSSAAKEEKAGELPEPVARFNVLAAKVEGVEAISINEIGKFEVVESSEDRIFYQSGRAKEVLALLKWLDHGDRQWGDPNWSFTAAERATPEWNTKYVELMKLVEGWQPSEEPSTLNYFFLKSDVFEFLVEKLPSAVDRDNFLKALFAFLSASYSEVDDHTLWFKTAHDLMEHASEKDREYYLKEMAICDNVVLNLYATVFSKIGLDR